MAYKKRAIPLAVRREVARRYGAEPGKSVVVTCHYCPARLHIEWLAEYAYWPMFLGELDHVVPEFHGGPSTADNLVLACRPCNRSKGYRLLEVSA